MVFPAFDIYSIVILMICFSALVIGSVTDIRRREVPDWVSYGLVLAGIGANLLISLISLDFSYILFSIFGLILFVLIAFAMYYAGQWGGGDSKVLMGIGAALGLPLSWPVKDSLLSWVIDPMHNLPLLFYFLIFTMLAGSAYGLAWSAVAAARRWHSFKLEFISLLKRRKTIYAKWAIIAVSALILSLSFFSEDVMIRFMLLGVGLMITVFFYLFIYIKSVEVSCMRKLVKPEELTEGDWIVDEIAFGKKVIAGPKDLGISKDQINELVMLYHSGKLKKKVLIKEGIPFVPSFLFGLIAAVAYLLFI